MGDEEVPHAQACRPEPCSRKCSAVVGMAGQTLRGPGVLLRRRGVTPRHRCPPWGDQLYSDLLRVLLYKDDYDSRKENSYTGNRHVRGATTIIWAGGSVVHSGL